ncbi:MAG: type II toxin-antitoxin system VapC family toxin [Acidobacteria bacterium]|nr:type II toxin-antitoxin system VapC family toxin [Acidobacteriota bacterium]
MIALLEAEPAGSTVSSLILLAQASEAPMWMTVVNLGEVWYRLARAYSQSEADSSVEQIRELGFEVQDADWTLTRQAAQFKSRYRLSYADCFAAALAKQRNVELVTGDPEFRQLEKEIKILWL